MAKDEFTTGRSEATREAFEAFGARDEEQAANLPSVIPQQAYGMQGQHLIGAQEIKVPRDEARILEKLRVLAAAAGERWFYRFPVKKKGGGKDYIEGPSIKLANELWRLYGNCDVSCLAFDMGDRYLIQARFVDFETGATMTRPWVESKSTMRLGGDDDFRNEQGSLQIGVSKAIRNVITNALETLSNYAFQEARGAMVDDIGKNLDKWRKLAGERFEKLGGDYLARAERIVGRPLAKWLAEDIARTRAMIVTYDDGMADLDDLFPPIEERQQSGVQEFAKSAEAEGRKEETKPKAEPKPAPKPEPEPGPQPGEQQEVEVHEEIREEEEAGEEFGKASPPTRMRGEEAIKLELKAAATVNDLRDVYTKNVKPFESDDPEDANAGACGRLAKVANARKKELERAASANAKRR